MKQKILFIILTIFFILYFGFRNFNVNATMLDENNSYPISFESFNLFKGYSDDLEDSIEHYNYYVAAYLENADITITMTGEVNGLDFAIYEEDIISNGKIVEIKYSYEDTVFFHLIIADIIKVEKDEEIFLGDLYNNYQSLFIVKDTTYEFNVFDMYDDHNYEKVTSAIKDYRFSFLVGTTMNQNTFYLENDCHIVMSYANKLTLDEIIENVTISDLSGEYYTRIVNNTYDYYESDVGTYSLRIIANDTYNHYSFQDVIIDVVDLIEPKIKQKEIIKVPYDYELTKTELIQYFEIDEYSEYDYEFDLSNYNKKVLGTYDLSLTVTDIYGNEATYYFSVLVEDNESPQIGFAKDIIIDNLEKKSIEEIRELALLSVVDNYDGDLIDKVVLVDLDDYENNNMKAKTFRFMVEVYDSNSNYARGNILVNVIDVDYPTIEINKYMILTQKGASLNKEDIINLFNSLGYSLEKEDIDGDCFTLSSLSGEYEFIYTIDGNDNEGTISTDLIIEPTPIEIIHNEEIIKEEGTNITLIIVISIFALILSSSIGFGIILYKKKH